MFVLILLSAVALTPHSRPTIPVLILFEIGIGAILLSEALLVFVMQRLTIQAKEVSADSFGLILRWKFLIGSRLARVPWDRIKGRAFESGGHGELILHWGLLMPFSSRFLAFRMDRQSYSLLKPIIVERGKGILVGP